MRKIVTYCESWRKKVKEKKVEQKETKKEKSK